MGEIGGTRSVASSTLNVLSNQGGGAGAGAGAASMMNKKPMG